MLSKDRCFAFLGGYDKGGRPASFIVCRVIGNESELLWLGVKPERQRRGGARVLISFALDEACSRGAETMVLEVAENNLRACRLYESLGFVVVGCRPGYYRQATGKNWTQRLCKYLWETYQQMCSYAIKIRRR